MDLNNFIRVIDGTLIKKPKRYNYSISIDTRTIKNDDIFIPICFKNGNGNHYVLEASKKASLLLIPKDYLDNSNILSEVLDENKDIGIIEIDNGLEVLKRLALYKLNNYHGKIIAITGSNGKTSTKELLYLILKKKYRTFKAKDSYNNILGLCLMILELNEEEYAIFEMGMNHEKEISEMSKLLKPDIALITNIGTAHIGNLKTKENILKAKLEILDGLKEDSVLFINNMDDMLKEIDYKKIIRYNYLNSKIKNNIIIEINDSLVELDLIGNHNIYNISAAYAVSKYFNIDDMKIIEALKEYPNIRMKKIVLDKTLIIDDTYNANYESMINGIDYINETEYENKILILGDILELGIEAKEIHKSIGRYIKNTNIDKVYTYGDMSKYIGYTCNKISYHYNNIDDIITSLKKDILDNTVMYFKASRGIHLDEILKQLVRIG